MIDRPHIARVAAGLVLALGVQLVLVAPKHASHHGATSACVVCHLARTEAASPGVCAGPPAQMATAAPRRPALGRPPAPARGAARVRGPPERSHVGSHITPEHQRT